jgi:hypothetical protein
VRAFSLDWIPNCMWRNLRGGVPISNIWKMEKRCGGPCPLSQYLFCVCVFCYIWSWIWAGIFRFWLTLTPSPLTLGGLGPPLFFNSFNSVEKVQLFLMLPSRPIHSHPLNTQTRRKSSNHDVLSHMHILWTDFTSPQSQSQSKALSNLKSIEYKNKLQNSRPENTFHK